MKKIIITIVVIAVAILGILYVYEPKSTIDFNYALDGRVYPTLFQGDSLNEKLCALRKDKITGTIEEAATSIASQIEEMEKLQAKIDAAADGETCLKDERVTLYSFDLLFEDDSIAVYEMNSVYHANAILILQNVGTELHMVKIFQGSGAGEGQYGSYTIKVYEPLLRLFGEQSRIKITNDGKKAFSKSLKTWNA